MDIEESLYLLECSPIVDERHKSDPATVWFVAPSLGDRLLFVAGIWDEKNSVFIVRAARDASDKDQVWLSPP